MSFSSLQMMHHHLLPIFSSLIIITSLALIHIQTTFCQNQLYQNCSVSFQCGNLRNVGYPFWGGDRSSSCGYPGFELSCDDNIPFLTIDPLTYRVLAINDTTQTLTLARNDLSIDTCPSLLYETKFNFNIFDYSSDSQNLTLSYGCVPLIPLLPDQPNVFECSVNDTTSISFFSSSNSIGYNTSEYQCNSIIRVPFNQTAIPNIVNSAFLRDALTGGFGVKWEADNNACNRCSGSGGICGHDSSSNSFVCHCSDQQSSLPCGRNHNRNGRSNSVNTPVTIGLSIAGATIAGICIGWLIFFCRQRKKRIAAASSQMPKTESRELSTSATRALLASSTTFTKSIPSYPSSISEFRSKSHYFGAQVFSYGELEEATDNFSESKELGDGGFGTVYFGVLHDGRIVAVKRLYENNFKRVEQFMNEVEILTGLRHPNLVTLYGCTSRHSRELLLVYDYISNGTVADHLHGKHSSSGLLSWSVRMQIAIETSVALAYLHSSDIIHRDVKTNNILLDDDYHVKVADFGLSRLFPNDVTHVSTAPQGTPGYVDPEYHQCYQLTEKSDVYSFGVVLIELISSLQAVDTNRHRHDINLSNMAVNKIQNDSVHELVDPSLGYWTNSSVRRMITLVAELAFRCLQQESDMRPSMQEIVDTLKKVQTEGSNDQKVEVLDILVDDGESFRENTSSSDSAAESWTSSTPNCSG